MISRFRGIFALVFCLSAILAHSVADNRGGPTTHAAEPTSPAAAATDPPRGQSKILPLPEAPFRGRIERNAADSTPDFPQDAKPPAGAPNVLLIMTDDVGFGASSTFGGPIPTPTMDRLAASGLRYNRFHTNAFCSPTRAALLTGRNHHTCGTGVIMEFSTGYPGYNSLLPKSCATIGEILKQNGYNTAWFGKNHNTPDWQNSQAGPFDRWPTGLGFDYFYGFMGALTDQWHPGLYEGTKPVEPPYSDPTYHLDRDLADHAVDWIHQQHSLAPDKPFFLYYAPGSSHSPHHAPKDWIAKFKGQFDQGWDKLREETLARQKKLGVVPADTQLTPRPKEIPAWDSLSPDQHELYSRMMEVYAADLAHCDDQIGRVVSAVEADGQLDNTLIIYIQGDNGPSPEGSPQGTMNEIGVTANGVPESLPEMLAHSDDLGGPLAFNNYPVAWGHAMATPFQWMKRYASHFGGTRNGMVISWPKRIKDRGGIRSQFHHVIDIAPTILEATRIVEPTSVNGVAQKPIEGVSMMYSFDDAAARSPHRTQYFEIAANRGIYRDGWVACTTPRQLAWVPSPPVKNPADDFQWELYHVDDDFSESHNLAQQNPAKLHELQDLWWSEAKAHNVLPLNANLGERWKASWRPSLARDRSEFTYHTGTIRIPEGSAPDLKNRSYRMTAEVEIPAGGAEGVLATQGGRFGGWGLLVLDGKPEFIYAYSNRPEHKYRIASNQKLTPGKHTIHFEFAYDGGGIGKGGTGTLSVDGTKVASGRIEHTLGIRLSLNETFDIGQDTGTPVVEDYVARMPFKFTGRLEKVLINLDPQKLTESQQQELRQAQDELVEATE